MLSHLPFRLAALAVLSAATMPQTVLAQAPTTRSFQNDFSASLVAAEPIFGKYTQCQGHLCNWQSKLSDHTELVTISLPGTHDSATWNYTQATQDAFIKYTGPLARTAAIYRCQSRSLVQQLNEGLRVFDLRFGTGPDGKSLVFYHALALLDLTTTIQDVFTGFYKWLDDNPTEAVLIFMKLDNTKYGADFQQTIYDILNSDLASQYWVQADGKLGTLGEARGKLTLLRRFSWGTTLSPTSIERFGLDLSHDWQDNSLEFDITYNSVLHQKVFIEDYYMIDGPDAASSKIRWKFNATSAHLDKAVKTNKNQLFVSFASAGKDSIVPPVTPKIIAVGNGTDVPGVNHKLLPWFNARKGGRFGIVLLDWYEGPSGLVEAIIGGRRS